jgi:HlyD family secretion protein
LVERARAELNLAYVKAPKSGQILKIRNLPGEVVGNEGIVDLGQTGEMYVRVEVYETDIQRVRRRTNRYDSE